MVLAPYYPSSPDGRAFKFRLSHPRRGSPGLALLLKGPRGRAASAWRVQCALTAPSLPVIHPVVSVRWHPATRWDGPAGVTEVCCQCPPGVCAY